MVSGDTSLLIELTGTWASLRFLVSDSGGALQNIQVTMDGRTSLTDISGMAIFSPKPARVAYPYSIAEPGYKPVQDTFYLDTDTVLNILLEAVTGAELYASGSIMVFPNPASDKLIIDIPVPEAILKLVSIQGKLLLVEKIYSESNSLDISALPEGIYLMQVQTDQNSSFFKLMIRR